jgi:protein-tyrosine-phosphatase
MAAALAASVLPEVAVESAAGVMPGDAVAEKAISVVKEMTGLDISSYRPRDLAEVDLTAFDRIVVLDRLVAEDLARVVPSDVLVSWDVRDPYGGSLDDYRQCGQVLRALIEALARDT